LKARGSIQIIVGLVAGLILAAWVGCAKDATPPTKPALTTPETELTYAPLEGDTSTFRVHFFWNGYDTDGEVVRFRYALDADTANAPETWIATTSKDTTLLFLVDPVLDIRGHVFWVAAEDNDGKIDPTPAKRFFSAKTLPPTSHMTRGIFNSGGTVGPNFTFEWEGIDPDGSETGGPAPVDSFEYLLLQVAGKAPGDDVALPPWPSEQGATVRPPYPRTGTNISYKNIIDDANGPTLPDPWAGWKWHGIRGTRKRFQNVTPDAYVFAIRAVDIAGSTEKSVMADESRDAVRNVSYFIVTNRNAGPSLQICSSVLVDCLPSSSGPEDIVRKEIQVFEGETISFSWHADATSYGGVISGYTFALDDTTTAEWGSINLLKDGVTLLPSILTEGIHFMFVRAVDDGGLVTNQKVPIRIVHPTFKDAAAPFQVRIVDDFASPGGNPLGGSPNYPADTVDDDWWLQKIQVPLSQDFPGFIFNRDWDTIRRSEGLEGRGVPKPADLADYRVVIWWTDFNNTTGQGGGTGLWNTLVGGAYSQLAGYLRAGGTLILTGFQIGFSTINPPGNMYSGFTRGLCATIPQSSPDYRRAYFPREFLGIDGALSSDEGTRTNGARDFIEARVTPEGSSLGFTSAQVDVGTAPHKWNPNAFPGTPDVAYSPGLPKVEGWKLQTPGTFACLSPSIYAQIRKESPGPITVPLYTYHGLPQGLAENGPPSKREGYYVGVATQAHDLGQSGGGVLAPGASGAIGRMVVLGFPIYYLPDPQAYSIMRAAFAYVNGSPTLPQRGP
jgi:hypothetical protein